MVNLRRRAMVQGSGSSARLPSAYQEVEWIENDGSCYIFSGVSSADCGFEVKFISFDEIGTENSGGILGGRYSNNSADLLLTSYVTEARYNNGWRGTLRCGAAGNQYDAHLNPKGEINIIRFVGTDYTANGVTYTGYNRGNFGFSRRVLFFAQLNNSNSYINHGHVRLFYAKMYTDGELMKDYVPCYRKSDDVIGLYDLVGNAFVTKSGTGTLTKGDNV